MSHKQINYKSPVKPMVKWAGGKSRLIKQFKTLFPEKIISFVEPFFGGGAVFFHLLPPSAVISDKNEELINFYLVVRDHPGQLLSELSIHINSPEYFYKIRGIDPSSLSRIQRASRFLYLNKHGYNGLWRVNRLGLHNVPFGRYKNIRLVDENNLRRASNALAGASILCEDFEEALDKAKPGTFIYLDPPYHPLNKTARFTSYTSNSFGDEDQRRLARSFIELDRLGCQVMLSNSDTPLIRSLYQKYNISTVTANRAINCRTDGRGPVNELVIRNYP